MANATKGAIRSMKNVAKGYTELQIKVREATSNDPWGPSTELMHQIAQHSHTSSDFTEIMQILSKRLNDHGRNWRHVYKALILLDYLILCGSEQVVEYAKENSYVVKTLKEFQYVQDSVDYGANVRQKAQELTELLADPHRYKRERQERPESNYQIMSDRYASADESYRNMSTGELKRSSTSSSDLEQYEEDMRNAIRESLKTIEEDKDREVKTSTFALADLSEDEQLQQAIEMSKRDEMERQKRLYSRRVMENFGQGSNASPIPSSASAPKNSNANLIDLLTGDEQPISSSIPQPTIFDPFGVAAPVQHPFHVPAGYHGQSYPLQAQSYPLPPPSNIQASNYFPQTVGQPLTLPPSKTVLALPAPQSNSTMQVAFPSQPLGNDFNSFSLLENNPHAPNSTSSSSSMTNPMVNLDQLTVNNPFSHPSSSNSFQWNPNPSNASTSFSTTSSSSLSLNQLAQQSTHPGGLMYQEPPSLVPSSTHPTSTTLNINNNATSVLNTHPYANHSSTPLSKENLQPNLSTFPSSQQKQSQNNPFLL